MKKSSDGKWQLIKTAPKTSGSILVYCPVNLCIFTVTWGTIYGKTEDEDTQGWKFFGCGGSPLGYEPSHWQPLPERPKT